MLTWKSSFSLTLLSCFALSITAFCDPTLPSVQKGLDALTRSFPEVAIREFRSSLETTNLSPPQRQEIILRLAESYLRAGQAEECLALLDEHRAALPPEQHYWRALGLLSLGKAGSASLSFDAFQAEPSHLLFLSLQLNKALLKSALNDPDGALDTLRSLSTDQPVVLLHSARYALQAGRFELAEDYLAALGDPAYEEPKGLLLARIKKQQNQFEQAAALLRALPNKLQQKQGREATALLIECLLEIDPPAAFPLTTRLISQTPEGEALGPLFDAFLLSAATIEPSQVLAILDRWILEKKRPLLSGYALYTRAQLEREAEEKLALLRTLSQEHEDHPLAKRALVIAANLARKVRSPLEARSILTTLLAQSESPQLKALLSTWLAELSGGAEKTSYYQEALQWATPDDKERLEFNLALSQLQQGNSPRIDHITIERRGELLLAKSDQLRDQEPTKAAELLEEYLRDNPTGSSVPEAQLRLAELLIQTQSPPLFEQAQSLVTTLQNTPLPPSLEKEIPALRAELALAKKDYKPLEELSSHSFSSEILLMKAAHFLYQQERYYSANLYWEQLQERAKKEDTSALAQYYSALTKLKIAVGGYRADAYQQLAEIALQAGPYQQGAREVLAAAYLSEAKTQEALALLELAQDTTEVTLLKARAYAKQTDPQAHKQAVALYQALLRDESLPLSTLYTVAYRLILHFEETSQYGDAIDLYYRVANFEALPAPVSQKAWSLYYRIGSRGLALFEQRERWLTAYQFAKVLTQVEGPQYQQFRDKARQIALEHQIWEE